MAAKDLGDIGVLLFERIGHGALYETAADKTVSPLSADRQLGPARLASMAQTRTALLPLLVLAALSWAGPLGAAAQAQVGVDVGGAVDDATGAVDGAAGAAGDTVGGAVESITLGEGAATTLDQEGAIEAVESRRALPLEQIMTKARLHTQGEIVDAQLVSVKGFLLYELKVVEANGDVDELYFYALSGERVQTN